MKVITLSRQVGSYGDEVAKNVASELGLHLVDQEEVRSMAEACDTNFKDACSLYEREVPKGFWERFFFDDPAYASLFESLNYELASKGDVILMGRGAQIVLLNVRGVMRARVVAPVETRVERIAELQKISIEEAREFVKRHGHRRRALIESIYQQNLNDWALYDLVLNTRDMTADEASFILIKAAENMRPWEKANETQAWLARMATAKKIESAIRKVVRPASFSRILVDTTDPGAYSITGAVPDDTDKEKATSIAKSFEGVENVDNQMKSSRFFSAY